MSLSPKITIVDYGVGNLHSLSKALKLFTSGVSISYDAEIVASSDALVLPGDGAFQAGIHGLNERALTHIVLDFIKAKKPVLGICLGAQILLSQGHEFGTHDGLDIIPGSVVSFPNISSTTKLPHIGWNQIFQGPNTWTDTVLDGINEQSDVYFIHSFVLSPENERHILSMTTHGGHTFCSAVQKENVIGLQFHPEKSGNVGLEILKNFIALI